MPTAPRLPDDQPYDGLLVQADLPPGWHLPGRFPGGRDDASGQIDAVLGYNDQVRTAADRQAQLDSDQNETVDGRWLYIEHESTGTRVLIRLQRQLYAVPEEVRITGVVYLPWRPGDPITSQLLRELPTARIEASINKRLFAMNREDRPAERSKECRARAAQASRRHRQAGPGLLPARGASTRSPLAARRQEPQRHHRPDQRRRPHYGPRLGRQSPRPRAPPRRTPRPRRIRSAQAPAHGQGKIGVDLRDERMS
jgi:hypothetical protein